MTNKTKEGYSIFTPFGPILYRGKVSDKLKNEILHIAKTSSEDRSGYLAGNLEKQVAGLMTQEVLDEFSKHAFTYVNQLHNYNRWEPPTGIEYNTISIKVHRPWVNVQKKGEWNPSHTHSMDLSCVIYAQVPDELKDEWKFPNQKGQSPVAGKIDFIYGNAMTNSCNTFGPVEPAENDIWIFPAWLTHQVYPFNSDVERISCSTNFSIVYENLKSNEQNNS